MDTSFNPDQFGLSPAQTAWWRENGKPGFRIARVIAEHRERYVIIGDAGELDAEITGHLRFTASGREDFPAVGDWVDTQVYGTDLAIIHRILPRYSMLSRQAPGTESQLQVIAANVDTAFLVQAADRDFNLNRLDRYIAICRGGSVSPVLILTKIDLLQPDQIDLFLNQIHERYPALETVAVSALTDRGMNQLRQLLIPPKTHCLLGSSGVGKSTLLNALAGDQLMETAAISDTTGKGRHTTSHRELVRLPGGALLLDTPGMRELGIADGEGLDSVFDRIASLASDCKFSDCMHESEVGCAVRHAVETGLLDESVYASYRKLDRERRYFSTTAADRKRKEKQLGKLVKSFYQEDAKRRR